MNSFATEPWLVIGFGNTLRQDDGAGPAVAERLAELEIPGLRAIACPLLSPELAEAVAQAGQVIFVDASAAGGPPLDWQPLEPAESPAIDGHALTPATLLALARHVYGRAPRSFVLAIAAHQLEFGENLSPGTFAAVDAAVCTVLGKVAPGAGRPAGAVGRPGR